MKYVLVWTDGYSIRHQVYTMLAGAQQAMMNEYKNYYAKDYDIDNESYITTYEAVVVRTSEERWIWRIIPVQF